MSDDTGGMIREGQKQLDDMLTTLHQAGFITLITEEGKEREPTKPEA